MSETFQPGTVKPEADYEEIVRLGAKLGIPVPMMYVKVEATNPDGSPGERYEGRSRTFNRNFWNLVFQHIAHTNNITGTFGEGFLAYKYTNASVVGIGTPFGYSNCPTHGIDNTAATATGIVVGTGATAESFENHILVAKVAHGSGAGQLSYTSAAVPVATYAAGSKVWTAVHTRILNNNSAGTIVVAETGIYCTTSYSGTSIEVMTCRDLLGATVSVLAAGQLTVTYTITLTFAA